MVPAELENSVTAQQLRQEQDAVATYDESTASHLSALLKAPFVVNTSDHSLLSHGDRRVNRAALPSVSASFFTTDGVQKPSTSGALDSCALHCAGTLCFCLGPWALDVYGLVYHTGYAVVARHALGGDACILRRGA